jgi:hypothetical protein
VVSSDIGVVSSGSDIGGMSDRKRRHAREPNSAIVPMQRARRAAGGEPL